MLHSACDVAENRSIFPEITWQPDGLIGEILRMSATGR